MKKIFAFIFVFIITLSTVSADDFFDSYVGVDNAWDGQKPITNKEFEDAINVLQGNQKKKEAKQRKKKIKKISGGGTSLHEMLDPNSEIKPQGEIVIPKEDAGQLLNLTVNAIAGDSKLEPGFYNIFAERDKDSGEIYILFYQGHEEKARVKAYETENDYGEDSINFVKILPYNENFVKIVFGSLDFNAYAYVQYYEPFEPKIND